MPRTRFLDHRDPLPDVRYRDKLVGKFLNILMSGGKKSTAERICYGAFDVIQAERVPIGADLEAARDGDRSGQGAGGRRRGSRRRRFGHGRVCGGFLVPGRVGNGRRSAGRRV